MTLEEVFGMSAFLARRVIKKCILAIDDSDNPELQMILPTSSDELENLARGWDSVSNANGIFYGVLGAIDGWLCCIDKPLEVGSGPYFSGHYQRCGINVQAICDANCQFIYLAAAAPEKNDVRAFNRLIHLCNWMDSLSERYCLIGDNAYCLQNNMLIPYSGVSKNDTDQSTYNFYLSQMRIRIEMAFGRLCTK